LTAWLSQVLVMRRIADDDREPKVGTCRHASPRRDEWSRRSIFTLL
jgi:hypothetical protein